MKKFLSILLAGIMLACMIPTVAFAEDAPSGIFVGETQYSSIDAAAANSTSEVKADFVIALTDAKAVASSANQTTLQGYIDILNGQGGSN